MAVLVAGGAGYIGSHTAVALHEAGREVVIVDNFSNSSPKAVDAVRALTTDSMAMVEVDMLDSGGLARVFRDHDIDEVIHFAAYKAVGESVDKPLDYYRNNLGSTIGLVEAMVEAGVSKLVFSSSCTVYGQPSVIPVTEAAPTGAESPYGWTKYMSEQILSDAAAAVDLDVVLLRYFNPVGAHESGTLGEDPNGIPNNLVPFVMQVAVGRLEKVMVFGGDYDTADGTAVRDYIHVVDLAEGHVAALDALAGEISGCTAVNLGTGVGHTVLDVVHAASAAVGSPIPYEVVDRRAGDIEKIYAHPACAKEVLGWSSKRDLADMMRDHWNWQRQNPNGFA
ncbi:MAG: UDP-glucose 4-epimerase GalE [Acidimicrobiales bacterium]|nr:UDP-glucose 4-epimerase GalE [Acidimicrobiales bacterium]MDG2218653.1 UDP-glucose 4-epimerase GalE [Acidimicrobiales bacterium]